MHVKNGFLQGYRSFIRLDDYYLKGPYGGILLFVVSLDANNGLFLLVFMVVELENKDLLIYFVDCLDKAIEP